ncbi:MAG: BMC domain-containing protein [Calditrichaceae bacterium]|nr:BMC domain-containing protein [Calditrichaceae bacterium]MBN2709332.1 BMC domain-containing protein [Calditrichaceae bacterium]RQV94722.1 MAG: BMC domain-containing protein [Calditrichota bacterium]
MDTSYGFIETRGFVAAIEAADAMVKAANVQLIRFRHVGSGLVTVIVEGPLDACQAAVQAGKMTAEKIGELVSAHVIPRPEDDIGDFIEHTKRKRPQPPVEKKPESSGKPQRKKNKAGQKSVKANSEEDLLNALAANPAGLSLSRLAELLNREQAELRIIIKKLMDFNRVEKIQQRYFLISKGGKK